MCYNTCLYWSSLRGWERTVMVDIRVVFKVQKGENSWLDGIFETVAIFNKLRKYSCGWYEDYPLSNGYPFKCSERRVIVDIEVDVIFLMNWS